MDSLLDRKDTTIFIVDDEVSVHRSLKRLVNSAGYRAMTFESALEFIDSRQHFSAGILVLNVRMPEINGLELQQFLIDSGSDLPIIFISADDNNNIRQQAKVDTIHIYFQIVTIIFACFYATLG